MLRRRASAGAIMKPRASRPTTTVGFSGRRCSSYISSLTLAQNAGELERYEEIEESWVFEDGETIEEENALLREVCARGQQGERNWGNCSGGGELPGY
jgi:hypothetical protein